MAPLNPFAQPFIVNQSLDYQQHSYYHGYNYLYGPVEQYPLRVATYHAYDHQVPSFLLQYCYYCDCRTHDGGINVVPSASGNSEVTQEAKREVIVKEEADVRRRCKVRFRERWEVKGQKYPHLDDLEIKEDDARSGKWTSVMIKNIPNKLEKKKILELLDEHCMKVNEKLQADGDAGAALSEFDFLYLPIDFKTGCNLGYAFVNFTTPTAAMRLYRELHRKSWACLGSHKVCEVTYARLQGLSELLGHFSGSIFSCETKEYLPIRFIPGRNGLRTFTKQHYVGKYIRRQK